MQELINNFIVNRFTPEKIGALITNDDFAELEVVMGDLITDVVLDEDSEELPDDLHSILMKRNEEIIAALTHEDLIFYTTLIKKLQGNDKIASLGFGEYVDKTDVIGFVFSDKGELIFFGDC
jgi:hypothetical protein